MLLRQLMASWIIGTCLLVLIVRMVQRGHMDIAYCWVWLGIGGGICALVLNYDWLVGLSDLIGSKTPTTTLFLLGFLVLLLFCLQFSLVISTHRRQIKRLTQQVAILESRVEVPGSEAGSPGQPGSPS